MKEFLKFLESCNDAFLETVYDELEYLDRYGHLPTKASGLCFDILSNKMRELYGESNIDDIKKYFYKELARRYRYDLKS